ncbi:OmpW family outer membrane protein [Winogradskyella sp.]|uniref:OmpW family outer membrane protein n=1 Tax=Winogradskyella sp. TaxID=1883156 RepID=UPI003516F1EC
MRKFLFFAVLTVFSFSIVFAQEGEDNDKFTSGWSEGDITLSGSLNYSRTSQDDVKDSNFGIMPQVGYFFNENLQGGLSLGYMSSTAEAGDSDIFDESTLMLGAFLRYYCMPESRFAPFASLGINYMSTDDALADVKFNGFNVGVGIGADFFLNDDWALTTSVGAISYTTEKADFDGAEARNTFALDLDFKNVWFGVIRRF